MTTTSENDGRTNARLAVLLAQTNIGDLIRRQRDVLAQARTLLLVDNCRFTHPGIRKRLNVLMDEVSEIRRKAAQALAGALLSRISDACVELGPDLHLLRDAVGISGDPAMFPTQQGAIAFNGSRVTIEIDLGEPQHDLAATLENVLAYDYTYEELEQLSEGAGHAVQ